MKKPILISFTLLSSLVTSIVSSATLFPALAQTRGGILRVVIAGEPPLLDPTASTSADVGRVVNQNVLEGLLTVNSKGRIVPQLARSYSVSSDGLTLSFKLRTGVKFHDGSSFEADDVLFALGRARDPKSGHTHPEYYTQISKVSAPDKQTVVLTLKERDNDLLFDLARQDSVIGPSGRVEAQKTQPIGTGPFKFRAWNRGQSIELERFSSYWNKSLPYLDRVSFRIIPDLNAQFAALRANDVDIIGYGLGAENLAQVRADPNLELLTGGSTAKITLGLNNSKAPFNDIRVRKALQYATNKPEILEGILFGQGKVIGSHRTPAEAGYLDFSKAYPYNIEQAKKLLEQAGYNAAKPLKFTLELPAPYQNEVRIGTAVAAQWAKAGIRVELKTVEWSTWLSKIFTNADYQATIIGHVEANDIGIYNDPQYYFRYNSPRFQAAFKRYQSGNPANSSAALGELQKILSDDAVNVWVVQLATLVPVRKGVKGWEVGAPVESLNATRAYLSK